MNISKTIHSDPINKWVLKSLDTEVFIVGGYVRDLLRGHISKDKDFVLKNNIVKNIAFETAKKFNGTLITLKAKQTYRVVLKKNKVGTTQFREVLDFSSLKVSIKNDLKARDFTINAIAWSPKTGIIDPFGGRGDLTNHIVKAVRMKNLTDDPLRIIRAYRIAAELGFKIENRTRKWLKCYSKGLTKVASERITEELFKILSNKNAGGYLIECYKDRVLEKILSPQNHSRSVGTTKNVIKKTDSLSENIRFLTKFDLFLKTQLVKINKSPEGKKIAKLLNEEINQGLNRLGLIRLALLIKVGTTRFRDGSISNSRLRVSNNINKAVRDIHNGMNRSTVHTIRHITAEREISDTEMYKIFNASGKRIFETAILLSFLKRKNIKDFFKRANEYWKVKNKILLNGNDVQKILNINAGIKVGKILTALQEHQFKGLIKTKSEAKKWLLLNFT